MQWERLSNQHEYLLLRVQGRDAVMALGGRTQGPLTEDWFSAQREWLQLRDGRIQAVRGMVQDWLAVRGQAPAWADVDAGPVRWQRVRDAMPRYRFGLSDEVLTRSVQPPLTGLHPRLQVLPSWRWYEDEVHAQDEQGQAWVFRQRFAVDQGRVVYSEQCTAPQWCFQMLPRAVAGALH